MSKKANDLLSNPFLQVNPFKTSNNFNFKKVRKSVDSVKESSRNFKNKTKFNNYMNQSHFKMYFSPSKILKKTSLIKKRVLNKRIYINPKSIYLIKNAFFVNNKI